MSTRKVQYKPDAGITPCPKCGNKTHFTAHSEQTCEDSCDVWVVCKCGYDPTAFNGLSRVEDTWGGTSPELVWCAIGVWDEMIQEQISNPKSID